MGTIRLQRSSEYVNRFREYGVYIDGKKRGVIRNSEVVNFEVGAGEHAISARIDWCSSPTEKFMVGPDDVVRYKVSGFRHANWLMPTGGILGILFLVSIPFFHNQYAYGIFIAISLISLPGFLLLIYYITLGRRKYLSLTEQGLHTSFSNNTVTNESDKIMLAGR